ncbi:MAG: chorismate mutase [Bdellovibrionales bacterium]|nr:chorismate mutase [Bdellovibrionales bacterium]
MRDLEQLRQQIDALDDEIVAKLERRAELVLEVKKAKQKDNIDVYSPARERQILDRIAKLAAGGPFPAQPLERIFINIISATRSLIGELAVSYVGPQGSLGGEAAIKQFGEAIDHVPAGSLEEVFAKVERGDAQYGVVPARTSATGLVTKTFDLLMQSNLVIIAEIEVKERLCLYTRGSGLGEVQRIFSDVHSFARAEEWLKSNVPAAERVVESSLSGALRKLDKHPESALLWLESLSGRHDLHPVASGIEGDLGAETRFVVLGSKSPSSTGKDKTSLLCSVPERAGALREILQPFSVRGVTLLRIESRSMRNRAWEYVFFIDVAGHEEDPKIGDAIRDLRNLSSYLKVLGSYPMVCQS